MQLIGKTRNNGLIAGFFKKISDLGIFNSVLGKTLYRITLKKENYEPV